ncbi:unnamed protein product [Prunus armeniaca]
MVIKVHFLQSLANQMKANGEDMKELKIMEKILQTLIDRFEGKVTAIDETHDLSTITIDELQRSLQAYCHAPTHGLT